MRTETTTNLGTHLETIVEVDGFITERIWKHLPKDTPQIGDSLEELLTSHGITKEWSDALKANNNREPTCQHDAGDVGVTLKVECSCSASGEKGTIVHDCEVASIRRCLPNFHPNKKDRIKWHERKPESDIYQLCDQCEHFRMKDKP